MSVFSQVYKTGQGNLTKDPNRLCWGVALETMLSIGAIANPTTNATWFSYPITSAGFWTAMAAMEHAGAFGVVNQVAVDDTYVTVADVDSGSGGVLTHMILPGATTVGDVSTVKITLDGVELTELAFTHENVNDRFFAGPVENTLVYGGPGSAKGIWGTGGVASNLAIRHTGATEANKQGLFLLTPSQCLGGFPCLKFDSTLKVEMKTSDFTAAVSDYVTNNRDDCAAIYILNQF